jgi:lipopolysaccharide/colanic/teichoic acid biosynthesis glycosyltransferase
VRSLRVQYGLGPESSPFEMSSSAMRVVLDEKSFQRMIAIERKRTERTKEPFLLMLLDSGNHPESETNEAALASMGTALLQASRETDVVGWYKGGSAIGVMFTGLQISDKNTILSTILNRVKTIFKDELVFNQFTQVGLSFHLFPDDWDQDDTGRPSNPALYPDLMIPGQRRRSLLVVKRTIDIVGSALALLVMAPLFMLIALAIKLTSRGPVFFRQERVGQYGKCFTMLKFRSMYVNNDSRVHKQFVTELINNQVDGCPVNLKEAGVYKLRNDKRITRIGKMLRRTSLDELPQFLNVLSGEMSLVGPRPALRYELEAYQTWHRRRILEAKPGITGLWQVIGRSRVKFDEMVRMDLRYAMQWSPWLDLKILVMTPLAVIRGTGAH